MRKALQLTVAGIALVFAAQFTSCKKDKKDDPAIVGTWQSTSANQIVKINGTTADNSTVPLTNYVFTFNSDNTFKTVDTDDATNNTTGTYSVSGTTLYTTDSEGDKDTATIQVTSTELTMTDVEKSNYMGAEYETTYSVKFSRK